MENGAQVTIELAGQDARTLADLDALEGCSRQRLAELERLGAVQFYAVRALGGRIGTLALGLERDGAGKWLIIHALRCKPVRGLDVTGQLAAQLRTVAVAGGCAGLRCWTRREGLRRKLERLGARRGYVMELAADGI